MNEELDDLVGIFTYVLYRSEDYMVARFRSSDGDIIVTGSAFDFENKQKYHLYGNYVDHPRYGFQFQMLKFEKVLPSRKEEIISYLGGKSFKGIGKKSALKVYEKFGDETLLILKDDPELCFQIDLSEKQQNALYDGFMSLSDPQSDILFYLVSNGFSNSEAQKIFNTFKLDTLAVGKENPFSFYNDVYSMNFLKVRNFAAQQEFTDQDIKFKESYLIYLLTEYSFNSGNIYIEEAELETILMKYGGLQKLQEALETAVEHGYITHYKDRFYLTSDYNDERFIAHFLNNFKRNLTISTDMIEKAISDCESQLAITYDESQKQAIENFFANDFSLIVGGPGTGKTTIVKSMVMIFKDYFPFNDLMVIAPTGRAAKRINEVCDCEAKTIHSLLRWNKETNTFILNEDNPITYDALIIDEFSMVDNSLFASLLKAAAKVKKICIIGDNNQLPSIRPGDLLNDLLCSERFKTTRLLHNYRQNAGNEIIDLAADIINDEVDFEAYKQDIQFIDLKIDVPQIISMIAKDMENGYDLDEIQVLSPMYKGEWGIDNLNVLLQDTFNPPGRNSKEKKAGKYTFRISDKILQLKNRPNDDVYNGDIGILKDIDEKEKYLLVDYTGTPVFYQYEELNDIALAYAMSVHKAQGSEYPIVYFVISANNIRMLNKKLIYTAISRAKEKLVIIGTKDLFMKGLKQKMKKRKTSLQEVLSDE